MCCSRHTVASHVCVSENVSDACSDGWLSGLHLKLSAGKENSWRIRFMRENEEGGGEEERVYIFLRATFEVSTSFMFQPTSESHLDKFPNAVPPTPNVKRRILMLWVHQLFLPWQNNLCEGTAEQNAKKKWFVSPRMTLICMTTSEETRTERQRFDMKRLLRDKLQAGKIFSKWTNRTKTFSKSINNCKKMQRRQLTDSS